MGEELSYSPETRRGDRNRQIGIHAYAYWVTAFPEKKYLPKILTNHREIRILCDDIEEVCMNKAIELRVASVEEDIEVEVERRAENLTVQKRNRCGAASFFPE